MLGIDSKIYTNDSDYTLDFGSGLNNTGCIQFTDRAAKKKSYVEIAVNDREFQFRVKQEWLSARKSLNQIKENCNGY
jgi:hypothetical protein